MILFLRRKGLLSLRGALSLLIAAGILYAPAYIQIIIGVITLNNTLVTSGVTLAVAIATPILPIGWTVIPLAIGVLAVWNKILKKLNIKYKGDENE